MSILKELAFALDRAGATEAQVLITDEQLEKLRIEIATELHGGGTVSFRTRQVDDYMNDRRHVATILEQGVTIHLMMDR